MDTASGGGTELAIFLPGLTYRNDRAGLHYPQLMMRSRGVDVMAVDYMYDSNAAFQSLPETEQLEWIGSDGRAILQAALDRRNYERLTVIGKSLGTIAMGWAIPRCALPARTRLVWLTPAVVDTGLEERMNTSHQPSLIVIGTLDPGYSRDFVDRQRGLGRTVLVLEGVDHGLECSGDAIASSIAITTLLQELARWLDETNLIR